MTFKLPSDNIEDTTNIFKPIKPQHKPPQTLAVKNLKLENFPMLKLH